MDYDESFDEWCDNLGIPSVRGRGILFPVWVCWLLVQYLCNKLKRKE